MTTIETNIPIPEANKKVARRARKKKGEAANSSVAGLIKALQFVGLAQKSAGTAYQMHCLMNNGWCVAFDERMTIGCKIEENISACPRTEQLLAALQKCGDQVAISQLSEYVLSIRSDKFKASIPCVGFESIPATGPDPLQAPITDAVRAGFETCGWLVHEGEQNAYQAALLLQGGSIVGTNGHVLLEHWHGLSLPGGLLIPARSAAAIVAITKKLVGFGCSATSATFYFEDESFLKTQLFDQRYPNYEAVFTKFVEQQATPLPADFFVGVEAVKKFSESKFVYLLGDKIQSHVEPELGATYDLAGIPNQYSFNYEYLTNCAPHFKNTVFADSSVYFQNGPVRGACMGGTHFK